MNIGGCGAGLAKTAPVEAGKSYIPESRRKSAIAHLCSYSHIQEVCHPQHVTVRNYIVTPETAGYSEKSHSFFLNTANCLRVCGNTCLSC